MSEKNVYVVIELHADCPKIRGVFENKEKAEQVAYKDSKFWRNVVCIPFNKEM